MEGAVAGVLQNQLSCHTSGIAKSPLRFGTLWPELHFGQEKKKGIKKELTLVTKWNKN